MPYIEKMQKSGNVIFVNKYHTLRYNDPDKLRIERRKKKYKKTSETQQAINDRNSAQRFIEYGCENFTPGKAKFIRLGYRKGAKPEDIEKAHHLFTKKFLKKLKRNNKELMYMGVTEEGVRGGLHHHLLVENFDLNKICELWPYGEVRIMRTYTGELSQLISYLTKGELDHILEENERAKQHKGVKRILKTKSTNLRKPEKPIKKIITSGSFRENPKSRKIDGVIYDVKKSSYFMGVTDNGYLYQKYILVRRC